MTAAPTVVYPFVGAGDLRLGMTRAQVEALAGPPDDILHEDDDADAPVELWGYRDAAWLLRFDGDEDWRLCGIDLSRPLVEGLEPFGLSEPELLSAWSASGLPELKAPWEGSEWWDCTELSLLFWFAEGQFSFLTVSPRISDEDESFLFPESDD